MITVNRPLDYEQVPGGMIYLTLMAIDGGAPALNSTVPITVELFVSNFLSRSYVTQRPSERLRLCLFTCETDAFIANDFQARAVETADSDTRASFCEGIILSETFANASVYTASKRVPVKCSRAEYSIAS